MRTRREFLKRCCAMGAAGASMHLSRLGLVNANAQTTSGYKAMICIFLNGGNDGNNTVVPLSPAGFSSYQTMRQSLALAQNVLLPVTAQGAQYGLHPNLGAIQSLYNQNKVAIIFNVGTLVRPLTMAQFKSNQFPVPRNLYSHSDQTQQWQTANPTITGGTGWGGRITDILAPNTPFPAGVSVSGGSALLAGSVTRAVSISPGSQFGLKTFGNQAAIDARFAAMQQILTFDSGVQLIASTGGVLGSAMKAAQDINTALSSGTPLTTVFPNTGIGQQLSQVAKIIQVRNALGMNRQIFFASAGGYDTHSNLINDQGNLFNQLNAAIGAFQNSLIELQVEPDVVTFIESEFGRTGNASQTNGSDHAWGSHTFVIGAPVKAGGYGTFPTLALGGPDDVGNRGVFLPTTALDQFGATLASWFGVLDSNLTTVFPNLGNFTTQKLAFL